MKHWLKATFLIFALAGISRAGTITPSFTYNTAVSSVTTQIITVSNASSVIVDTPTLLGRVVVEIQNIDATANLWCLPTNTAATNAGRKIAAGNSWIVSLVDTVYGTNPSAPSSAALHFYCVSDGGGSTKAAVTQAY